MTDKIFQLPPVTDLEDQAKYAFERIELFLNERVANIETRARTRIVSGGVSSGGSVDNGSGFTSAKNSTGNYTVTFDDAFSLAPDVVTTGKGTAPLTRLSAVSTTAFTLETFNTAGMNVDSAFTFIAHRSE